MAHATETKTVDDEPVELSPCLFIGSIDAANNHKSLREKGITTVISVAKEKVPSAKLAGVQYAELFLDEDNTEEIFDKSFSLIDSTISDGGSVLVHCVQGISRSGSVCIGYMMNKTKRPFPTVHRQVKDRRPVVEPSDKYRNKLIALSKKWGIEEKEAESETTTEIVTPAPSEEGVKKEKRESRLSVIVSAPPILNKVVRDKTPAFKWASTSWQEVTRDDEEESGEGEDIEESEIAILDESDEKEKKTTKEKEVSKTALPLAKRTSLKVLTYNAWYADRDLWTRFRALSQILQSSDADIICLQELRADVLKRLISLDWVREKYYISDCAGFTLGQFGVAIFSKLEVHRFLWYPLPSSQQSRMLLRADFNINGKTVSVINCQLEPGAENASVRKEQLAVAKGALSGADTSLLIGDFSLGSGSADEEKVIGEVLNEHKDPWTMLHPSEPGFTVDNKKNTLLYEPIQARSDRILFKPLPGLTAKSAELIGNTALESAKGVETQSVLFPSTHFGVIGEFTMKSE